MNLWNIKSLPIPPINTYKAEDAKIDIKHLSKVFREGKEHFDNEHYMRAEYKVMSVIIYRMKQKFRCAKDFKALEKICKALDNYFEICISKDLKNFMNLIPPRYTDETYLPNKSVLDYILVRLQGMVKLLERIVETCKITAYLFNRRLHTGHFWKIGFIVFSLVSRIYILAKYGAKFICEFYNKLLPFSRQLKNSGRNWLPENYVLPTDLQKWMNVDWLDVDDELQVIEASEIPSITQFFDLVNDDDDIQFCDEYIMIDDDDVKLGNEFNKLVDVKESIQKMRGFDMDEDIGEVIEVDDSLFEESIAPQREGISEIKENNFNFGRSIEINDSLHLLNENTFSETSDKGSINEIIILDNSLSNSKENCSEINEVIELDDSSLIISENDVNTPNNSRVINIFDNSLSDVNPSASSTPLSNVLQSRPNSINLEREVVTLPNTPVQSKRNKRNEGMVKKGRKNLKNDHISSRKSSLLQTEFVSLCNEAVTLPKPSIISKRKKKERVLKNKVLNKNIIPDSKNYQLLQTNFHSLSNDTVTLPKSSPIGKKNKKEKLRKNKVDGNSITTSQQTPLLQTGFVSLSNETLRLPKLSAVVDKRYKKQKKALKKASPNNDFKTISENCSMLETDVSLHNTPAIRQKLSVICKRNSENVKAAKTKNLKNKLRKQSKLNNKQEKALKKENLKNGPNSKRNKNTAKNDEETVINISDSSSLQENQNENRIKRKKLKSKRDRNTIKRYLNSSSKNKVDTNVSKSIVKDPFLKTKKRETKQNGKVLSNVANARQIQTEYANDRNRKRKWEGVDESSCEKVKKCKSSISEWPKIKSPKENKLVRRVQSNVQNLDTNSAQIKIKQDKPILIKTAMESNTLISGVKSNKRKFKKPKKKNVQKNAVHVAQQTNSFKHLSNKNTNNLKNNQFSSLKRKKYRYFH
ncbi:MATH and LRR domain-containing protein PFE0570w-like [Anoplophora glabripennis]|uniref:MATH and LRR domain-containing protein PFE0570w-like n=1 Tax=Anoplophora glabripennis TaxID=217634 RepID=UPI000874A9AA|nr:MATH and LRR domain-containing protein PFE0570w-like [Anoplophora glabripennis]